MKGKKFLKLASVAVLASTLAACGKESPKLTTKDYEKWAEENGWVRPDAEISAGATELREKGSGAIALVDTKDGTALLKELITEMVWTADTVSYDSKDAVAGIEGDYFANIGDVVVNGGRQMFNLSTSYNNAPQAITAELTVVYNETTGKFQFIGSTAANSGKVLRAAASGKGFSISWVKQLREFEHDDYDWNYYDSYGIQFETKAEILTAATLAEYPEDASAPEWTRLFELMDQSLKTIKEWSMLWDFEEKDGVYTGGKSLANGGDNFTTFATKAEYLAAKKAAAIKFFSYEDMYICEPTKMVVIFYFARPLNITAKNAYVYNYYADVDYLTIGADNTVSAGSTAKYDAATLATSGAYKAAVWDANGVYFTTEEGRALYKDYFGHNGDAEYDLTNPESKNIINKLLAYKKDQLTGANAEATKKAIDNLYLAKGAYYGEGGTAGDLTKLYADIKAKMDSKGEGIFHWRNPNQPDVTMPDAYLVTYVGTNVYDFVSGSSKAYARTYPNWNRYFALQTDNLCGLSTRQSLTWE